MTSLTLENLSLRFPGGTLALDGISLTVAAGERLVLFGASGSGKTSILRIVAGLLTPTAGRVLCNGEDITHCPPQRRGVRMVGQNYPLYPHWTVAAHLNVARQSPTELVRRVSAAFELDDLWSRYPAELSGGEQQRVALARAMVQGPRLLLLDEPLSNLDEPLRERLVATLRDLQRELQLTMLYVCHDRSEAFRLADQLAILDDGKLLQWGPAPQVQHDPASVRVAKRLGHPAENFIPGRFRRSPEDTLFFDQGFWSIPVDKRTARLVKHWMDRPILLGVRPQDIRLRRHSSQDGRDSRPVSADVNGSLAEAVDPAGTPRLAIVIHTESRGDDDWVTFAWPAVQGQESERLVCRNEARLPLVAGDPVLVNFETWRLQWFDALTGQNLLRPEIAPGN